MRTVTSVIKAPRVIILVRYEGYHRKQPKFNRINIFRRDADTCQLLREGFSEERSYPRPCDSAVNGRKKHLGQHSVLLR